MSLPVSRSLDPSAGRDDMHIDDSVCQVVDPLYRSSSRVAGVMNDSVECSVSIHMVGFERGPIKNYQSKGREQLPEH